MKPLIVINFKNYKKAIGDNSLKLAKRIAKVRRPKYNIIVSPPLLETKEVVKIKSLTVAAQHCDPNLFGAHTGAILAADLKKIGVKATILNHSEKKIPFKILSTTIEQCKLKKIKTIVCASTLSEIKKVAALMPDYIAYEPKELIGSNISVTSVKPDIIVKALSAVKTISKKTRLLVGAGVHSKEDLGQALLLGASGVLIAHAVVEAKDPKRFLEEMLI